MFRTYRVLSTGVLLWAASFSMASAAVFNVNIVADVVDNDITDSVCMTTAGGCSLRAAIQQANATPDADVINLIDGVYRFSLPGNQDDVALSGDLDVHSEITINGNGGDQTVIDARKLDRVFQVHSDGNLVLNKVTVRNGLIQFGESFGGAGIDVRGGELTVNDSNITLNYAFVMGGGISNFNGTVTINRSVIYQNMADGQGGGIINQDGKLTINDSEISANGGARFFGGGIYNSAMADVLEINNSTITGHGVFVDGGGIYHLLGGLNITNSTISGNTAGRNGGGLFLHNGNSSFGGVAHELRNVTIANNNSGLFVEGNVLLKTANTIIADNTRQDCVFKSAESKLDSLGHNLDTDGSCTLLADASSFSNALAGLAPLTDNGGVTRTHALLAGSDALDAGDDELCPWNDQRGYTRPAAGCDIGAYEEGALQGVEQSAPPANQGSSTPNTAPIAFNQPLVVNAGGAVTGVFSAVDFDGDVLTFYQVDQPPSQGDVGRGRTELIPGEFIYTASASATGTDSFTFYVCDALDACSEPATISITFGSEPIAGEMVVELASETSAVSPLVVAAPSNLDATVADLDYSRPFGVFYFDVQDIPTAANLETGTVVVIQLPPETVISPDAVIRKLDVTGSWQTLQSAPSAVVSTGVIDVAAKTLTLTLRDNDMFDANPELGVIRDPVAIAVLKSDDPSVQDLQATVAVPAVEPEPVVSAPEPTSDTQPQIEVTPVASNGDSGGGASFNPLLLTWFALLMLLRRKPCQ